MVADLREPGRRVLDEVAEEAEHELSLCLP